MCALLLMNAYHWVTIGKYAPRALHRMNTLSPKKASTFAIMFEHKFLLCFGIIDKDCIQNARPKADSTLMYYQRTYSMV